MYQIGLFLLAVLAGALPFAVPQACGQALREGLALCAGPLLLSLFPFLVVSSLLVQCPAGDLLAIPLRPAAWCIGVQAPCAARVLLIGLFGFWELSCRAGLSDGFLVSCPSRMAATFWSLCRSGQLWRHIGVSCLETVAGFTVGTLLGTAVAVLMWWSDTTARILDPYLVVLNALPKTALGPIFIVRMGAGTGAIVTMTLAISLNVTIQNMYTGFSATDPEKVRLMRTLGATRRQILWMLVFPANCPTLFSTLKVNVGLSWVGVIMGEFLVSRAGLGYLIVYGSQVFNMDLVMTSVLILAAAAGLMYLLVLRAEAFLNHLWGVRA